jgi:uncharacterized heparinase superfamily protein
LVGLREGLAAWQRLGPIRGAQAAARLVAGRARAPVRRARIRLRPLRAGRAEVEAALGGGEPVAALRGPALRALPTVERWEEELAGLDESGRADLLRRAENVLAHRFDLLGSGPVELGRQIDWQRDFKSGRSWPLTHVTRVPITYPDDSDIKVPWELSRFQHLPLLAAAHRVTGDEHFVDELGAQLVDWINRNPVEVGANWACTMDVAFRATNWVAALVVCSEQAARLPWLDQVLGSLLLHGRFIRSHLEWGEVRGNHYLSDVVGLLAAAALFSGSAEGRQWFEWAADQLVHEMEHQVRPDGCDHEGSIPYHRLVTELFVCGTRAVDALAPGRLPGSYHERLGRMLEFVRDYTRPDGLAPQIGDADDGRFLPLGDYGRADHRSHLHLFQQAGRAYQHATGHAAYPDGGYYVMRAGILYVIVRCGDTGLRGIGGHAHNDQLSFELCAGRAPLVVDPGAYLYTADPRARNLFRSTAYHATLQVGAAEQNELREDYLFTLPDRSRAEPLAWDPHPGGAVFEGRHHGFSVLDPPAVHRRRLELRGTERTLAIRDVVISDGAHDLDWTFPLVPGARAEATGAGAQVESEGTRMEVAGEGLDFRVEEGWYSPSFGVRVGALFLRARRRSRPGEDTQEVLLTVS